MTSAKIIFIFLAILTVSGAKAQSLDDIPISYLQFATHLMSTQNNFEILHGNRNGENDDYIFYESEKQLGQKNIVIAQSKKDSANWIYYVEFSLENDLEQLVEVEPNVFKVLNKYIGMGKITGEEGTEGAVTKTTLYVKSTNEWLGELITDNEKKKFSILLMNSKW